MDSDRLSIFANLADFQHHIDMGKLTRTDCEISYTACVLALSLANGDLSFLLDENHWNGSALDSSGPSWLPSSLCLGNPKFPPRHIFSGRVTQVGHPCVVLGRSLVAPGILWEIQPCSDLRRLQDGVRRSIERCKSSPSHSWHEGVAVLKATLKELFRQEKEHLIILVITLARQQKWESPADIHQALKQLRNWYQRGSAWPAVVEPKRLSEQDKADLRNQPAVQVPEIEPSDIVVLSENPYLKGEGDIPHCWGDPLLRWVYFRVLKGAPFPLGVIDGKRQGDPEKDAIEELAIFKLKMEPGRAQTFVPMAQLNYEFGGDAFLQGESTGLCWRVRTDESATVSVDDKIKAAKKLKEKGAKNPRIAEKALVIKRESDLLGFWSPFLSASGVLNWNAQRGSHRMNSLENCEYLALASTAEMFYSQNLQVQLIT